MNNIYTSYRLDPSVAAAGLIASARQNHFAEPRDLSTDIDAYIPINRSVWKYTVSGTDFTGTGKNTTLAILQSKTFKIGTVYVRYNLPAQYARDLTDKFAYDSLPGINIISQIETSISGAYQIETVTPPAIIQRYIEAYGIEEFKRLAVRWWGGYVDGTYRGPLQTLTGINRTTLSSTDLTRNLIFPETPILLPVPACLFFNKEKFCFYLSMDSPVQMKFIFNNTPSVMTRSSQAVVTDLSSSLDVYFEYLNPNEVGNFWTGLSYTVEDSQNRYFLNDKYFETFNKTYTMNQDFRIAIKPAITTRLQTIVSLRDWSAGLTYFGNTVDSAVSGSICGMIWPTTAQVNPNYTFNLGTGHFVGTGTAISGTLSIVGWTALGTSFRLNWARTPSNIISVEISCPVPLGSFGDLYFDLGTYSTNLANTGFTNVLQAGLVFLCSSIQLNIRAYDATITSIENIEVATLTLNGTKKLARGAFTFNPNLGGINQHALWGVSQYQRSSLLTPVDMAFDYFASQPVPTSNTANTLVQRDFVKIQRNWYPYWDLDSRWPIEFNELSYEKQGSNTEILQQTELELSRPREKEHLWSTQIDLEYSLRDYRDVNRHTQGYSDYRALDILNYVLKLKPVQFIFEDYEILNIQKDLSQRELNFTSLQWGIRTLKYVKDQLFTLTDEERVDLNSDLIGKILIPNQLHLGQENGSRDALNGHLMALKSPRRTYLPDNYSMQNRVLDSRMSPPSKRPKYFYQQNLN